MRSVEMQMETVEKNTPEDESGVLNTGITGWKDSKRKTERQRKKEMEAKKQNPKKYT